VQTRGVDENELRVVAGEDAAHRVPGGLRLIAGDDDLAADQCVGERGLSGIGASDEAAEAGTEGHAPILPSAGRVICRAERARSLPVQP
jgi:hypothetical protein